MASKIKNIIIAEDDPGMQDAIDLIFQRAGYNVRIVPSGEPLLNQEFEIPDIFILDKQLSGVDGLDICRYLKSQPATSAIPVIMLSANLGIGKLSADAGADDFLEKPFKMKVLLEMVTKYA
ncbi:MAG: response regulator [Chitinophagaceae bacterium]|nr:MAG: response regulator [Chitinophagaceae bacterium]